MSAVRGVDNKLSAAARDRAGGAEVREPSQLLAPPHQQVRCCRVTAVADVQPDLLRQGLDAIGRGGRVRKLAYLRCLGTGELPADGEGGLLR
jgi:hypothetical protein